MEILCWQKVMYKIKWTFKSVIPRSDYFSLSYNLQVWDILSVSFSSVSERCIAFQAWSFSMYVHLNCRLHCKEKQQNSLWNFDMVHWIKKVCNTTITNPWILLLFVWLQIILYAELYVSTASSSSSFQFLLLPIL